MIPRSLPVALATAAFLVQPAFAQTTEDEAAAIREAMQSWIDTQVAAMGAELEGELTVTPDGDHYRAVIPVVELELAPGGGAIRFEETPVDIAPREDGWYDVSLILPEGSILTDAGEEEGRLTFGEQSATGVFAPAFRSFAMLDVDVSQLAMTSTVNPEDGLTADHLTVEMDFEETEPGVFDQPGSLVLEGLALAEGQEGFSLGRMRVDFDTTGLVLSELVAFAERFDAMAAEARPRDDIAFTALVARVLAETGFYLSGADISYEVEDLVIDGTNARASRHVEIPGISMGGYASGLRTETAELGFTFDLGGYTIDPPLGGMDALLPTTARVDMAMVGVPPKAAIAAVAELLHGAGYAGSEPDGPLPPVGAIDDLMAAGTGRLEIAEISLANAVSSADFSGGITPDMNALLGFTADGTLTVTGLDALIAEVRATGAGQDAEAALTMLRALGTPTTAADGEIVQTYDIQVTADGQALVNGTDLMTYDMMGGPPVYETAPPAANPKLPTAQPAAPATAPATAPAATAGAAGVSKTPSAPVGPPAAAPSLK